MGELVFNSSLDGGGGGRSDEDRRGVFSGRHTEGRAPLARIRGAFVGGGGFLVGGSGGSWSGLGGGTGGLSELSGPLNWGRAGSDTRRGLSGVGWAAGSAIKLKPCS